MAMTRDQSTGTRASHLTTNDLYRLASEFADEHGAAARDFAYRAVISFEADGEAERAYFWFLLLVMLGDIVARRIDPEALITIH